MHFRAHFWEAYLDREELEQTAGEAGYESTNNVKHGKIEDDFVNVVPTTAARDTNFAELTKTNGNLST